MSDQKPVQNTGIFSISAGISFLISIIFCTFLISVTIINKINVEKMRLEQQIAECTHRISEYISKLLYKTQTLSAIVIQGNGNIESFDILAPSIVDDPVIQNVLMAPDGIVTKIYPLEENSEMIGWNYFSSGSGNKEAMTAKELGNLVLAGPIDIIQGGQALSGRLPVFIDTPDEKRKFWGITTVTLKFPQVMECAEFEIFDTYGSAYELWRISPDTNVKQIIATNYERYRPISDYIEKPVSILNAEWYLRVSLNRMWYNYPENFGLIFAGFCISFIVFFVMQNNYDLKKMQSVFEIMAITDSLTGIFNRRHFLEIVHISLEKSRRLNEKCFLIMLDIDRFKKINDVYGHQIGDKVIVDIVARIKSDIRPYDIFARYGGEEFIIFASGINENEVYNMTERLRLSLCSREFNYDDISINVSASFGIAQVIECNLDRAIKHSDEALYAVKRNGRNGCILYNENSV